MQEYTTPLGRKIYVFESVIPSDVCQQLIQTIPGSGIAKYLNHDVIPKTLYNLYNTYCTPSPIKFVDYTNKYTYGSSVTPIPYHTDPHDIKTQQWKVLLYLNSLPNAGTIFREGGQEITTECSEGTVVVFDTVIPHLGNPRQSLSDTKYTIGFFPLTHENQTYFKRNSSRMEMIWEKNKIYISS
jgi:hypothetical protein